jgi:hypothetical protein
MKIQLNLIISLKESSPREEIAEENTSYAAVANEIRNHSFGRPWVCVLRSHNTSCIMTNKNEIARTQPPRPRTHKWYQE